MARLPTHSEETRAQIARMRVDDKMSNHQIATALGMSPSTVGHILAQDAPVKFPRLAGTLTRKSARGHKITTSPRKCLKCKTSFESEGAHNRICSPCGYQNTHTSDRFELGYSVGGR